jgi:hypothetical protein
VNSILDAVKFIAVALNLVLLVLLLRGYLKEYWLLFAFNLLQPAITLVEWVMFRENNGHGTRYRNVYWTSEIVWDLLLFVLLAVLIERVVEGGKETVLARKILMVVVAGAALLPFVLYMNRVLFSSLWFEGASQLYNLGAAILNLVLWGALIAARRRREPTLLLVCAGLGINVTGAAIQWGIRLLFRAPAAHNAADLFAALTYLAGLGIWCWAFRERRAIASPAAV